MSRVTRFLFLLFISSTAINSFAQNSNQDKTRNSSTYITPYVGVSIQSGLDVEQLGTAHKRGDFNEFSTDFDLLVDVNGKSNQGTGYAVGVTYGTTWQKPNSKLKTGFEFDFFSTKSNHESKLVNAMTEQVANANGDSLESVLEFVGDHYRAGHHAFSNSMKMTSLNAALDFTLGYSINERVSINSAIGLGVSGVTMTNAESKQSSPASANSNFEITNTTGEPVNHFNSNTKSSSNNLFSQFRVGTKISLGSNIAVCVDARGIYRGQSEFTFGSTVYTDHPPTNSWQYSIDKGLSFLITTGLCIGL
jgi:hypothetical protein